MLVVFAAALGFLGLCLCIAMVVSSSSSPAPAAPGQQPVFGGAPGQPRGRYVRQTGAKPPACGWYGCFPRGMGPSRSLSNGKQWLDVAGLTEANPDAWPRYDGQQFWNPYALNGKEMDGGILMDAVGDMPVVDPPKDRLDMPYFMRPSWQTGSSAAAQLYKQKCAKKVRTRGKLYYVGPTRGGASVGGYVWYIHPRMDDPSLTGWAGASQFIPQPIGQVEDAKSRNEDALDLMKNGAELPPWMRQGPNSAEQAIRSFCK